MTEMRAMPMAGFAKAIASIYLCVMLVACASGPALVATNPNLRVASGDLPAPDPSIPNVGAEQYHIGSMDLLAITVFGVSDLTQDVRVDSVGNITLPLVGSVSAAGRSSSELAADIATKLKNGFMQNPQVGVFIKEYASQRVTVEGVVKKPGVFPLTGPTSLLQVIATAQGLDALADHKGVVVFREVKGQRMAAVFDIDAIGRGAIDDPPIFSNDIVVVATSGSKSTLRNFIMAAPSFGLFRMIFP